MTQGADETDLIRIVLADANVLYSRVVRDYLLYAADQEIIANLEPPKPRPPSTCKRPSQASTAQLLSGWCMQ